MPNGAKPSTASRADVSKTSSSAAHNAFIPAEESRLLVEAGVAVHGSNNGSNSGSRSRSSNGGSGGTSSMGKFAPASDALPVAEGIPMGIVGGVVGGDGSVPSPPPSMVSRGDSVVAVPATASSVGGPEGPWGRRAREPNSFK